MPHPLPEIRPVLSHRDVSLASLSRDGCAVCFKFLFGRQEWKVGDLNSALQQAGYRGMTGATCDAACQELCKRGLLDGRSIYNKSPYQRSYELAALPPSSTVRELLRKGLEAGWAGSDGDRETRYSPYSDLQREPSAASLRILLAFLSGGTGLPEIASNAEAELWTAAVLFVAFLEGESSMPDLVFPPHAPPSLYAILGAALFLRGLPVAPLLEDWAAKWRLRSARWDPEPARQYITGNPWDNLIPGRPLSSVSPWLGLARDEYSAYCMWFGRADLLDATGPAVANSPEDWDFTEACRALAAGRADEAQNRLDSFRRSLELLSAGGSPAILATPASHLFLMTHLAFRPRIPKTQLKRLAGAFASHIRLRMDRYPRCVRAFFRRSEDASRAFLGIGCRSSEGDPVSQVGSDETWFTPSGGLGWALELLAGEIGANDIVTYSHYALSLAWYAHEIGAPGLAAAHLSAFCRDFGAEEAESASALAARIAPSVPHWFRPFEAAGEPWRRIVDAFAAALPSPASDGGKKGKTGRTRRGRIVWMVDLCTREEIDHNLWTCTEVRPAYRGPRAGDDSSGDKPLTDRNIASPTYAELFTEEDRALLAAVRASPKDTGPTPEVLERLCGRTDVSFANAYAFPPDPRLPAVLVRRDLPIDVHSRRDGGLALAVPSWCLKVEYIESLVRWKPGDRECSLYHIPPPLHALLRAFDQCSDDGHILLPKEAMDAFRPLLPRIAAIVPLQGDLAAVGGGDGELPRIKGDPTPLVRLRYEPSATTLSLSLHVRPLEDDPLVLLPGVGQPERLVSRNGQSAVLVRDLDAERKAAATVRAALSDFESWADSANPSDWTIDDLRPMLGALDALRALGDKVRLEWLSPKTLSVAAPDPKSWHVSAVGGAGFWFAVKGTFKLDDGRAATLSALLDAWQNRIGDYVPFGDRAYIRLTTALSRRLEALSAAARPGKDGALSVPPAALPMLDAAFDPGADRAAGLALPKALADRAAAIRDAFAAPVEVPSRLKAVLRPYQLDGYVWLSRLAAAGLGSCLADDMGLGKTVQIIALLLARAADGPSLVIAPASVCGNWRAELARFAPTLRPVMAWDADPAATDAALASAGPGDIVIAGYSLLVSRADAFAARPWNGVVLDEAQAIKNEDTKRARAVRRLSARFRTAATGTPVENRLADVWSLFEFLNPGLLGTPADFTRRFTADGRPAPALKRLLSPLILRRTKRDVLDDLPDKTEITLPVLLSPAERDGYETLRRRALETLERTGGKDNRISILAELTRLRRYCCHPSLVLGPDADIPSAKLDALLGLLDNLRENRHRALVFSQFTDCLAIVRRALDAAGHTHLYLDGQTPAAERARLVEAFQRGEGDFFLISLKAGGLGLNLTAANYVILLDPWWNPAVENQAADRAHRIGQKNPVTVYRLIAADTVEERVLSLHAEKAALSADLLDSATASPALTPDILLSLFR